MARNTPDRCRFCGDVATIDDDTFKPTGLCAAHAAPAVKAAHRARKAARKADRETVVVTGSQAFNPGSDRRPTGSDFGCMGRIVVDCPTCKGPMPQSYARKGYQCDPCADTAEGLTRAY